MKRTWKGYLFAGPLLLGFLLFYVLPFGQVVWGLPVPSTGKKPAVCGPGKLQPDVPERHVPHGLWNTMGFLGIGLPVILLVSYGLALFLKRQARRFQLLRTVFLLPYVMPVAGTCCWWICCFPEKGW